MVRGLVAMVLVGVACACGRISFETRGDAVDASECPPRYVRDGSSCYRAVIDPPVEPLWVDAEADCEADGVGAHLVVIDDAAEAARVRVHVGASIDDHFIGVSDLASAGMYVTVTGQPLAYLAWGANEPDGGQQHCVSMDRNLELFDSDCAINLNDYVCEYDGIPAVPAAYGQ